MKILMVFKTAGFIRHFVQPINELLKNNIQVHVILEKKIKVDYEKRAFHSLLEDLAGKWPNFTYEVLKKNKLNKRERLLNDLRTLRDYLRYFTYEYKDAFELRSRAKEYVPTYMQKILTYKLITSKYSLWVIRIALRNIEKIMPANRGIFNVVMKASPDAVFVSPLVTFRSASIDYLKTASELNIPNGLLVASWDNLTNKGLMKIKPDRVFVWNEKQKNEAITMHRVDSRNIVISGAQIFDSWFNWKLNGSRIDFLKKVKINTSKYILYLCSSRSIAPNEKEFVFNWINEVRNSNNDEIKNMGIMIRLHPRNMTQWNNVDLTMYDDVCIWPNITEPVCTQDNKNIFFNSIFYSEFVVGINSSSMIEAAILHKPVFTVLPEEHKELRKGTHETLHFRYLSSKEDGFINLTNSYKEHIDGIINYLENADCKEQIKKKNDLFIENFIRPKGIDKNVAPILADNIVEYCAETRKTYQLSFLLRLFRKVILLLDEIFFKTKFISRQKKSIRMKRKSIRICFNKIKKLTRRIIKPIMNNKLWRRLYIKSN